MCEGLKEEEDTRIDKSTERWLKKNKKIRRRVMSMVDIVDYDDYIRKVPPFLHRLKRAPF